MIIYGENNQSIQTNLGQTFAISLTSNASTGYTWEPEYDTKMMTLHERRFVLDDPSCVGGGGREFFTFEPIKPGESSICMNYQRSWEEVPEKTILFEVHILS